MGLLNFLKDLKGITFNYDIGYRDVSETYPFHCSRIKIRNSKFRPPEIGEIIEIDSIHGATCYKVEEIIHFVRGGNRIPNTLNGIVIQNIGDISEPPLIIATKNLSFGIKK